MTDTTADTAAAEPRPDCPACADERAAGALFCEACGRALTAAEISGGAAPAGSPPPQAASGATTCPACATAEAVGADGYCTHCGILAVRPRDHIELVTGDVGAVTDRGKRHHRNEDAVWIAARGTDVDIVVCDGVSSSFDPDAASAAAAETAGRLLAKAGAPAVTGGNADLLAEIGAAIVAAGADVAALAGTGDPRRATSNPSCTIVAACVRDSVIHYGWVGDSRAYWVPTAGPAVQLTEDDSWATHAINAGMDPLVAWSDRKAHAITAWLGADAGRIEPSTARFAPTAPGHLLLCSDGLWNYLPDHTALADTVRAHLAVAVVDGGGPVDAARSLTAYANDCGGSDNITVALTPIRPAPVGTAPTDVPADGDDQAQ
jgi:serine/threonine protein phosphatase PrpC